MQFHLNGFELTGEKSPSSLKENNSPLELPSEVDVLIVGAGPAGLTLAAQLAACVDVKTCIIEETQQRLSMGRADGIACRTMEMFNAFGFAERSMREAYWVNEVAFWSPSNSHSREIVRSEKIKDTEIGLSEFPHVILSQARVHDFFLEIMEQSATKLTPHYSTVLKKLKVDTISNNLYPVTVQLEKAAANRKSKLQTIRCRYVVGCDGAHSIVRREIGRELEGDSYNKAWGVMDILAVTNFPDIRLKTIIRSAADGNLLIIPREGGYMVRFYIELEALGYKEKLKNKKIEVEDLIKAASRILHPYTLDIKEVGWWSVYNIGQRLCQKFDDVDEEVECETFPRVFIVGDACHTHSPKAGQGMNVSMSDSFNLGWKLVSVLRGQASPSLLHTYSSERRAVAKELIDFDREFSQLFNTKTSPSSGRLTEKQVVDPERLQSYFIKHARYTAGVEIQYRPSLIVGSEDHQNLAKGFVIGTRFHSAPVIRVADMKCMQLGHTITADFRWRIFIFSSAINSEVDLAKIMKLGEFLSVSNSSPVNLFTPTDSDIDSVIDVRVILQDVQDTCLFEAMPQTFFPQKGKYGLRDYEKIFCSDKSDGNDIFNLRQINRNNGCVVLIRPDQYIAKILPLDHISETSEFFFQFMIKQSGPKEKTATIGSG
ncbi:MAG: FAD-binding protein [Rhodospirillaceae bacterium]|nr:FAD-binding protein [Rhodospirillaceae bacterium]MBT5913196.1 FAD-binding protein [Rhodospirillaceae bacterium]MDC0999051.1 FAD-dependent monooxygenase [Alphaproteobacteria bacterium]MDC1441214.1 FAD-dependent monooxygenase [Rhodospirillaceae bacterium]